jgi:hypothetical protein
MIALAGAEVSFGRAAGLIAALAGITVSARTIERSAEATGAAARAASEAEAAAILQRRIVPLPPAEPVPDMLYVEVDGTGVPVRASETEGRPGKDGDGQAGTREVKLARLFTVSRLDDDGRPVMDPGSSTYVATFDGKDALAQLVQAEYRASGAVIPGPADAHRAEHGRDGLVPRARVNGLPAAVTAGSPRPAVPVTVAGQHRFQQPCPGTGERGAHRLLQHAQPRARAQHPAERR